MAPDLVNGGVPAAGQSDRPTDHSSGRTSLARVASVADRLVAAPAFAYSLVALLQLRVLWGVWHRDVTYGDTSSYFLTAISWPHGWRDNIVWSPMYTTFFGSIVAVVHDVTAAVLVHRVIIVVGAALLVLALMRFLVGSAVGLLLATWWVVLPTNFNVEYEVHLFGLLPVLLAALAVARWPGRIGRATVLGIFAATTLLLRNELLIATLLLAVAFAVVEFRHSLFQRRWSLSVALPYLAALALVAVLTTAAYERSYIRGSEVKRSLSVKTELNLCQVYAFSFQQRHPTEFPGSPWTNCSILMQRDFGKPMLGFVEAAQSNPSAMAQFVAWNLRLLPSGLQVSLFGATQTGDVPGFFPVKRHRTYAFILSLAALSVLAAGFVYLLRDPMSLRRRADGYEWPIAILTAASLTTIVVAFTERPRPEYMYALSVSLLALVGIAGSAIARRWKFELYLSLAAMTLAAVVLIAFPSYYPRSPRPVDDALDRLHTVKTNLEVPGSVLIASGYNFEICSYLAADYARHCNSPAWTNMVGQVHAGRSFGQVLKNAHATVVYADSSMLAEPAVARFVAHPPRQWRLVGHGEGLSGNWSVLLRQ